MKEVVQMKWSGWGDKNITFNIFERPRLAEWLQKTLGDSKTVHREPISFDDIEIDEPRLSEKLQEMLANNFGPQGELWSSERSDRIFHTYGKSYSDLIRIRRGFISRAPDLVFFPKEHDDVVKIVEIAKICDCVIVPFGGGTNIVGGVEAPVEDLRICICVDLCRMNQVLHVDAESGFARIQAGAKGPELESQLQREGFSLGHFPDSFEYSTIGGWIATRSAGMFSDGYGRIEDMVVSLKVVTDSGTVQTPVVPASSAGPDLNRLFIGGEGIFGIITEATVRVHRQPAKRLYEGVLFRSFSDGVKVLKACVESGLVPTMSRLHDADESELIFHLKHESPQPESLLRRVMKIVLRMRGYERPCFLLCAFEGDRGEVQRRKKILRAVCRKYRGVSIGGCVGANWNADKFLLPYIRDYLLDHSHVVDVAETAVSWSRVQELYEKTKQEFRRLFSDDQVRGYVGCHISHTYATGACLYFTYVANQRSENPLGQYWNYKETVTQLFVSLGAALSHHHAVGYEHQPWLAAEISDAGRDVLIRIKQTLDPQNIFNPGKIIESKPSTKLQVLEQVRANG